MAQVKAEPRRRMGRELPGGQGSRVARTRRKYRVAVVQIEGASERLHVERTAKSCRRGSCECRYRLRRSRPCGRPRAPRADEKSSAAPEFDRKPQPGRFESFQ